MAADVQVIDWQHIAVGDRQCIGNLHHRVWPTSASDEPRFASRPALAVDWPPSQQAQAHVIRHQGVIVAVALSSARRVRCGDMDLDVLALAGVACDPAHRGRGHGAAVVRSAFARVDRGDFPVSLFQTGVPEFYRKLGCRTIDNPLVNSHSTVDPTQRPFWDDVAMIYPASFAWRTGAIDTLGPGW